MEIPTSYATTALRAIEATSVPRLLAASSRGAVVLERIAAGGGDTRWYWLRDAAHLRLFSATVRPGSEVQFYFDGRIKTGPCDPDVRREARLIAERDGEVVLGTVATDGIEAVDASHLPDASDLDEYFESLSPGALLIYGPYPSRDGDDEDAVTLAMPDIDGVVRPHPH